jgi:ketosteroid isomerase-like protein
LDPKLQQFLDEAEIRQVHIRYCRGIDRMDWDLVRSCYHPDAIDRHGSYEGGVEGFIEWVAALLLTFESTMHFTGNQYVKVDGNVAFAEHYARAFHRTKREGDAPAADWVVNARYVDRLEKRMGEWRIAERMVVSDSERIDPLTSISAPYSNRRSGRRDRTDPSYKYFGPA